MTPKEQAIKIKIDKLDFIKILKNQNINRVKRQPTERQIIFANHTSDRGLKSRTYRELLT